MTVNYDSFQVNFPDEQTCMSAVAAMTYAREAMSYCRKWLNQGLPTAFAMELAAVTHVPQQQGEMAEMGSILGKEKGDAAKMEHMVSGPSRWGKHIPLPDSWSKVMDDSLSPRQQITKGLNRALTRSVTRARSLSRVLSQCLTLRPSGLKGVGMPGGHDGMLQPLQPAEGGPIAIAVYFSTPMGMAVARIKPEHLLAVAQDPSLNEVLAVPVQSSARKAFKTIDSSISNASESSTGSSTTSEPVTAAGSQQGVEFAFNQKVEDEIMLAKAESGFLSVLSHAGSSGSVNSNVTAMRVSHVQSVFAVVRIGVSKKKREAKAEILEDDTGGKGADVTRLKRTPAVAAAAAVAAADATAAVTATQPESGGSSLGSGSSKAAQGAAAVQSLPAAYRMPILAAIAALLLTQLLLQPGTTLLLLLLMAVALYVYQPSLFSRSAVASVVPRDESQTSDSATSDELRDQPNELSSVFATWKAPSGHEHDWELTILDAELVKQPSAYLQTQVCTHHSWHNTSVCVRTLLQRSSHSSDASCTLTGIDMHLHCLLSSSGSYSGFIMNAMHAVFTIF